MGKGRLPLFLFIIILVIGCIFLWYIHTNRDVTAKDSAYQTALKKYPRIAPRILAEYHTDTLINFLALRKKIHDGTTNYGDSFAAYFEYLPTGISIEINAENEFPAASLFKVPVVMAYYHKRDRLGITDDPVVTITKDEIDNGFGTLWQKGAGTKIHISGLVNAAILDSDNTAVRVLSDHVDEKDFEPVYEGVDIDLQVNKEGAVITAEEFSSILKALYFSSVLSIDDSNAILTLMTKTHLDNGLAAGVPDNVLVAHKIGVKAGEIYTDCGIVYVPNRPYILCMVSQSDEMTANTRMKQISKDVYEFVSSANKN